MEEARERCEAVGPARWLVGHCNDRPAYASSRTVTIAKSGKCYRGLCNVFSHRTVLSRANDETNFRFFCKPYMNSNREYRTALIYNRPTYWPDWNCRWCALRIRVRDRSTDACNTQTLQQTITIISVAVPNVYQM